MPTCLFQALWLAIAVMAAGISPAYAYLDPGTGSIILQAVIGGLAMVAVTARLYWDKLMGFFGRRPAAPESQQRTDAD